MATDLSPATYFWDTGVMAELSRRGIEEILVEKGLLTADVVRELRLEAARAGRSVEDLI